MAVTGTQVSPQTYLRSLSRWHPIEIILLSTLLPFWLSRPICRWQARSRWRRCLRCRRSDPRLCRHCLARATRLFGIGAYSAGLFSKFVWANRSAGSSSAPRPRTARLCVEFHYRALPPSDPDHDHARPRPPAAEAANSASWLTAARTGCKASRSGRCSAYSNSISMAPRPTPIRWPYCS